MKKLLSVALCLVIVVMAASCGKKEAAKNVEGTLEDLIAKIYETADVQAPVTMNTALTSDNTVYMIGTADVAFSEGLASEPMMSSIPHSLVLLRVDDNANVKDVVQKIADNINPRKWVCVGVDSDQVIVDNIGNLVFVVMSPDAQAYYDSFKLLAE